MTSDTHLFQNSPLTLGSQSKAGRKCRFLEPEVVVGFWGTANGESKQTQVGLEAVELPRHTLKAAFVMDSCMMIDLPFYAYPARLVAKAKAPEPGSSHSRSQVRGAAEPPHRAAYDVPCTVHATPESF